MLFSFGRNKAKPQQNPAVIDPQQASATFIAKKAI